MTTCADNVCGTGLSVVQPKPGDPDNNATISAVAGFGGINVAWTYPGRNGHAVAHTQLFRGTSSNFANAVEIALVSGNRYYDQIEGVVRYFYWIRFMSVNGTLGNPIGPAAATSKSRKEQTAEDLTGLIKHGVLATALREDIARITLNYADLVQEIANRIAGNSALAAAFASVQSGQKESIALQFQETKLRMAGQDALAQQINLLAAVNQTNAAAILTEQTARVSKEEAFAGQITALFVASKKAEAALYIEEQARVTKDLALSQQITTAQTTAAGQISSVQTNLQSKIAITDGKVTGIGALYTAKVSVNGLVGGFGVYNDGTTIEAGFEVDRFWIGRSGKDKVLPFIVDDGTVYINKARIRNADIDTLKIGKYAVTVPFFMGVGETGYGSIVATPQQYVEEGSIIVMTATYTVQHIGFKGANITLGAQDQNGNQYLMGSSGFSFQNFGNGVCTGSFVVPSTGWWRVGAVPNGEEGGKCTSLQIVAMGGRR